MATTTNAKAAPGSRKRKMEQWFRFQKMWLANLRRELLGTDEHFGNPRVREGSLADPSSQGLKQLLPDLQKEAAHTRCLVLDLDETLVHTEFNQNRGWVTHRRPHVSTFLSEMAQDYEIVCFTSGLKPYASPIIDHLDPGGQALISHRLYRDHTLSLKGIHVKDLSRLNRDLARTIIIDNSPESYVLQPENAIPIKSFFGDNNDTSLLDLIPFLKDIVNKDVSDVRSVLKKCHLKGRFVNDSSKRKPKQPEAGTSEIAEARDRRISDLGSRQPQIPDDGDWCQRDRSMSDVDQLPEDMGVLWMSEGGMLLPEPIVIQEMMETGRPLRATLSTGIVDTPTTDKPLLMHMSVTIDSAASPVLADRDGAKAHTHPRGHAHGRSEGDVAAPADADAASTSGPLSTSASPLAAAAGAVSSGESGALLDWSSVHGSFAEVLRGMSPPPSFGLGPDSAQLQRAASEVGRRDQQGVAGSPTSNAASPTSRM